MMKPKGVAIAALAQYGVMPLTAFCLAKVGITLSSGGKRDSSPQNQKCIFFLFPVELFFSCDRFGLSCQVLEILDIGMSAFGPILRNFIMT